MTKQLRAVIYCRCSTEEESQIDALQKQVIEAKNCVEENNWKLVDQYVESRSGTTSKRRREYLRLFDDIATLKFDIIVIKSQDRLMRNTKDWYLFLDRLLTNEKRLYLYMDRKFYTTDDALITGIKAILAEEYSRELSKKIVNAHHHRQNKGGRVMLTNQVFGFEKLPDGNVRIMEAEAEIIRRIFQYCAAGYGSRTIANILQSEGVKSKSGRAMTPTTIRRMIRNPLLKGVFVMNRQHFDFETKRTIKNPEEQWIYKEGVVPAIVDVDLWDRANQAMSSRAEQNHRQGSYPKGSNKGKYILSGKLVCGNCGRPYYRTWRRGYSDSEKVIVEWKCSGYVSQGRKDKNRRNQLHKAKGLQKPEGCDNVHLDEEILFKVLEQLSAQYYQMSQEKKEGMIQKTIRLLERSLNENSYQKDMETLKKEEEGLIKIKQRLLDKLLDGIISDADYGTKNQELEAKILSMETKIQNLKDQLSNQKSIKQRLEEIKNKLEHGSLEKATVSQMLKDIKHIVVHEWQIEVQFSPMQMMRFHEEENITAAELPEQMQQKFSVFLDYPFAPSTEKGRIQDKIRVLRLLEETPNLTAEKISVQLGRTKSMVNSRMKELRQEGYIMFCGAGRHGQWEILQKGRALLSWTEREIR